MAPRHPDAPKKSVSEIEHLHHKSWKVTIICNSLPHQRQYYPNLLSPRHGGCAKAVEIRVYQEGDWFSLTDCNKDELPAAHTDQEPHFIVIGTIYFMSQWLYFFFFFVFFSPPSEAAPQTNYESCVSAAAFVTATPHVGGWWMQDVYGGAIQLSADVASNLAHGIRRCTQLTNSRCPSSKNLLFIFRIIFINLF